MFKWCCLLPATLAPELRQAHGTFYVFKRRNDGVHLINIGKTWEKLMMAARAIVAIETLLIFASFQLALMDNVLLWSLPVSLVPLPLLVVSPRYFHHNYITRAFKGARLIIVTDPITDHQAIREAAFGNIPVLPCVTLIPLTMRRYCHPC